MVIQKAIGAAAIGCVLGFASAASGQEVDVNSRPFSVNDYFYPDSSGDLRPYRVMGFAQPPGTSTQPRLVILPNTMLGESSVRFFRANGIAYTPGAGDREPAASVQVIARVAPSLPGDMQLPAIAAALEGRSEPGFWTPPAVNTSGAPLMHPLAAMSPQVSMAIYQTYAAYNQEVAAQKARGEAYKTYLPQQANLSELALSLVIDGEVVATRRFAGTYASSAGTLPALTLAGPTLEQQNKIRQGAYELLVSYRFRDTRVASINANFNAYQLAEEFLSETQQAITKNRSSGFQVFGIGSRRSKITTSINRQVDSQYRGERTQNTQIVMYDATDDMLQQFESAFFPRLQLQDVIQGHLNAAVAAAEGGQQDLAKIHTDYAAALQSSNAMAEIDSVAAAASLAAGDYASFIAQGVRASDNNDVRANNFRRIVTDRREYETNVYWTQVRQVSGQHAVSTIVQPNAERYQRPRWGFCGLTPAPFVAIERNAWGGPQQVQRHGLLVTCTVAASPALISNLIPGTIITAVAGRPVQTLDDFSEAFRGYQPGENIQVQVFNPQPNQFTTYPTVNVRLKRGLPVETDDAF